MPKKVQVANSLSAKVADFVREESIDWEIAVDGDCDIVIESCSERKQSNRGIIYADGWISCETARAIAPNLGLTLAQMGTLLNALSVKIRQCSLGCFE